ncbi:MAG: hypothetical protein AAF438_23230 [Pseudomonadota bacterium]
MHHSVLKVTPLLILCAACQPVPQDEILGANRPPARVVLDEQSQAAADDDEPIEIPGVDDKWANDDQISARTDNMINRADDVSGNFRHYVDQIVTERGFSLETESLSRADANVGAKSEWWDDDIYKAMLPGEQPLGIGLEEFISRAVRDSHQIKSFGLLPAIRETAVREAEGRFTPEAFAEARYQRVNDAATSPALTAGADRLLSDEGTLEIGIRSRIKTGAELTIAQQFSAIETNQTDFIPGDQARSQTTITLLQPLLRESGLSYNSAAPRHSSQRDGLTVLSCRP